MKLKALKVHGFKSFADSTEIEFHGGITAIVGPNGCGKSNISDAIRWALGEQRPTAIRGAKMEEAIFQGTVNRRPVNRASVSLLVSNDDGSLPVPFEEVELGRTVTWHSVNPQFEDPHPGLRPDLSHAGALANSSGWSSARAPSISDFTLPSGVLRRI